MESGLKFEVERHTSNGKKYVKLVDGIYEASAGELARWIINNAYPDIAETDQLFLWGDYAIELVKGTATKYSILNELRDKIDFVCFIDEGTEAYRHLIAEVTQ
jgi:hypothetical protein